MDFYVLQNLLRGGYHPSVCILEYNPIFPYDESYIVKYNERYWKDNTSRYGASLRAFEILMNHFNYTLVHVTGENIENNAIFINNAFITESTNVKSISELHPEAWVESHKQKKNEKLVSNNNTHVIKAFITEESFIKYSGEDNETN